MCPAAGKKGEGEKRKKLRETHIEGLRGLRLEVTHSGKKVCTYEENRYDVGKNGGEQMRSGGEYTWQSEEQVKRGKCDGEVRSKTGYRCMDALGGRGRREM